MKVCTVGSAVLDYFLEQTYPRMHIVKNSITIPFGHKILPETYFIDFGGGGINTAFAFKTLGAEIVYPMTIIGNDQGGRMMKHALIEAGIYTDYIQSIQSQDTSFSVVLSMLKDPIILSVRQASQYFSLHHTPKVDIAYITSLSVPAFELVTKQIPQWPARIVMINPNIKQGIVALQNEISGIHIFMVNEREAVGIAQGMGLLASKGVTHVFHYADYNVSMADYFRMLWDQGIEYGIVTHGKNGATLGHKGSIRHYNGLRINPVSSVGAGDSFGATFAYCIAKGFAADESIKLSIIHSGRTAKKLTMRSGLCNISNIMRLQKHIHISEEFIQT